MTNEWQFEEKFFLLELQAGRLFNDLQCRKMEVVMHGSLKMTWKNRAQNCCEEVYRPNGLNFRPMCVGFQRPLQSKGCPMFFPYSRDFVIQSEVELDLRVVYILCGSFLLTGSVQEKNLSHNKIDGYSVLAQGIQNMKALIIIARWDRHRPHHSLIVVRTEVYWFVSQNDENRIMIS